MPWSRERVVTLFDALRQFIRRRGVVAPLVDEGLPVIEPDDEDLPEGHARHLECYRRAGAHYERDELDAALRSLQEAIGLQYDFAKAYLLQGLIHRKRHSDEDAADSFTLAAHFDPGLAEAHFHLATLAQQRGDIDEARRRFGKAVEMRPGYLEALLSLGKLEFEHGAHDEAYRRFREVVDADPRNAVAYSNIGYLLLKKYERAEDALQAVDRAIELAPRLAEARCNRGMVLQSQGRFEEALAEYERALELCPEMPAAQVNRALARLTLGDFATGWPEYEARRKVHLSLQRPFPHPEWDGAPLVGRTVLVYAEQGLGDEIMFASCLTEIITQAGHCVIECHRKLENLYTRSFPGATVTGADQASTDLSWLERAPAADCRIAVGSLPLHLRRSWEDFPSHAGYLKADDGRVAFWRGRLAQLGPGLKVGLSWRGGTPDTIRINRSLSLADLLPLLRVGGTHFVSLQYTDCEAEISALQAAHGVQVLHWQEAIDDYDETAALVTALDLVVTVQTAVAHLSGALHKPVWVMVSAAPGWRYLRSGETLPWYPSMRLFRQDVLGEWIPVIERVACELQARSAGSLSRRQDTSCCKG